MEPRDARHAGSWRGFKTAMRMRVLKRFVSIAVAAAFIPVASAADSAGKAGRGKYLIEEVAHCQVCHTRRLADGGPDASAWLKGGTDAPDITSGGALWKTWGEKGMARFLQTGRDPAGASAAAHMPAYRLRPDDAEAIAAYLKSLK